MTLAAPVYIVAALPPPVHGQSLVNAEILKRLKAAGAAVVTLDISPQSAKPKSIAYHFRRSIAVCRAAVAVLFGASGTVYTVFESGYGFFYNLVVVLAARVRGMRIFIHHHTSRHCKSVSKAFKIVAVCCGDAATHVVLCPEMGRELKDNYGIRNTLVCRNYCLFDAQRQAPKSKVAGEVAVRLGFIANLSVEKGVLSALAVFDAISKTGRQVTFDLAGPVVDDEVGAVLSRYTNRTDFKYWGPVFGKSKEDFLASFDVLLFPTQYRFEAQPLVVIEAQQAAKVVFSSDVGYLVDMVPKGYAIPLDLYVETVARVLCNASESSIEQASVSSREVFLRHCEAARQDADGVIESLRM